MIHAHLLGQFAKGNNASYTWWMYSEGFCAYVDSRFPGERYLLPSTWDFV